MNSAGIADVELSSVFEEAQSLEGEVTRG